MLTQEVTYLICDFVPLDEFDNLATTSNETFKGVKKYTSHKEIEFVNVGTGDEKATYVCTGYKNHPYPLEELVTTSDDKYCISVDAIIQHSDAIIVVKNGSVNVLGLSWRWGIHVEPFANITWGGYRKIDDKVGGNIKSIDHVGGHVGDYVMHFDEDGTVYVRAKKLEDHLVGHRMIRAWKH